MSDSDADEMLVLLRECYLGLASAYKDVGDNAEAAQATAMASKVK